MVARYLRPAAVTLAAAVAMLAMTPSFAARVPLTAQRMAQLQQINTSVNATITEVSDLEQYGREDVWTLPVSGRGDCEDFALLKQKLLRDQGWPASALRVAVVQTREGEPHAVLTADTDQGLLVLDNKTGTIRPAAATGYVFHSRQSNKSLGKWVNMNTGEETDTPTVDLPVARKAGPAPQR